MTSLEEFINNNRDEFDSIEMKNKWDKIEAAITQKNKKSNGIKRFWYAVAAASVIAISATIYFTIINKSNRDIAAQPAVVLPSKELTDGIDTSYTSQMDQFALLIKIKQVELKQNQKTQPTLYKQFLQDNNSLDSSYNFLKSKLSTNPNKELLLDAIIQNLQLKLDLLNKQLQIIKQSKNKKPDNEKTI